eukprot:TRINITY_DN5556_c0_g1_i1.p1 TRINITY_DN5556_c0_g1~~TRINITY_DN5556_c0_g1_i1.p1  ORF type:complete len:509 (-),score=87.78 TRINITY_DN5556_c0_g1_i1:28-1533(-)
MPAKRARDITAAQTARKWTVVSSTDKPPAVPPFMPDDCWSEIFPHLSLVHLCQLQRVCARLRLLIRELLSRPHNREHFHRTYSQSVSRSQSFYLHNGTGVIDVRVNLGDAILMVHNEPVVVDFSNHGGSVGRYFTHCDRRYADESIQAINTAAFNGRIDDTVSLMQQLAPLLDLLHKDAYTITYDPATKLQFITASPKPHEDIKFYWDESDREGWTVICATQTAVDEARVAEYEAIIRGGGRPYAIALGNLVLDGHHKLLAYERCKVHAALVRICMLQSVSAELNPQVFAKQLADFMQKKSDKAQQCFLIWDRNRGVPRAAAEISTLPERGTVDAFVIAALDGDFLRCVDLMVKNGPPRSSKPLRAAVYSGSTSIVQMLVGLRYNLKKEHGWFVPPFFTLALECGFLDIAQLLLQYPQLCSEFHEYPAVCLRRAVAAGQASAVRFMMELARARGEQPCAFYLPTSFGMFMNEALDLGDAEIVQILVENGWEATHMPLPLNM